MQRSVCSGRGLQVIQATESSAEQPFQLNLPSITGYYGDTAQKKAELILKNGWYKAAGADCHSLSSYKSHMNREVLTSDTIEQLRPLVAG